MTSAPGSAWDDRFATRSPMFEPYRPVAARWHGYPAFPTRDAMAAALSAAGPVANASGRVLVAGSVPEDGGALAYERSVWAEGVLGLRAQDWHDLMNLLVWCVFPTTKARLNAGHVAEGAGIAGAGEAGTASAPLRNARRDALTLFDENGLLVASADPSLVELLRGFRWRELFVERRADVRRSLRFLVFGHGLLDKARSPFIGLTAHAWVLDAPEALLGQPTPAIAAALDSELALAIDGLASPRDLAPLPVLGIPGWWPANDAPAFYDDARYFRPGRRT
ncbi:MAG: DUF3025 domain-containing protein [Rhodocyclaceae bacterium]|nr:DUF3025 domain-containing protein [Rhodocyclaceae bacterium]MCA3076537.1 DUF3025 domain-containing protein [Rhodocyclaceae bacterium]MCA3090114.1 DUF3025 domain-containing protein [Rhodocyclaceae bacterium]MCA3093882.1 DUF3025 domain-containing protein [Rhodocyclaceae bacterium]MCA3098753.1 DUF3025 domain-containing protein [Rhodocyclaceae bacterium]